ncbi:MAG TPA: DUF58 domain-containing protein [Tepidisphaeraceae bacterium]|nr:DUF58 domain-containing protein [Tepidisphaeraceae bacterium]
MTQSVISNPTGTRPSRFLDLHALQAVARMRFVTRQQIEGTYTGRHRSSQQGGSTEFVDYREYSPGEDLRRLDWKVLGRTDRQVVRLYQDEMNLVCTLAIDASNSMRFGAHTGQTKLEYAQYLATGMSHVIGRQQDQVGLAVLAGGLRDVLAPGGTLGHVFRVQQAVENLKTEPITDLAGGLRELFARLPRRGVLALFSDFLVDDLEKTFASIRLFRHRRWEVIPLHLVHPDEERLPDGVAYRFEGMENEGTVPCSPREIRQEYEKRFEQHAAAVRGLALAAGCDYRRVSTAVPYMQTLGSFLVERKG